LQIIPKKTDPGAVDETVTYTLTASNGCGGSETRTAALHIVGSIEQPEVRLSMRSAYFPSNKPRSIKSEAALLPSERESLKSIADAFKTYLSTTPNAHLVLSGHADRRGPNSYNQALSERRAELAKRFLIGQGVPEASIETHAYGKEKNLTAEQVKELLDQNPGLTPQDRQKILQKMQTVVLANNRRVDITLTTTGQESSRLYPFDSKDYVALVDRGKPLEARTVENAAQKEKIKN
jgi:outer membrane protein OmpA-like peptidoglycan-associated protein